MLDPITFRNGSIWRSRTDCFVVFRLSRFILVRSFVYRSLKSYARERKYMDVEGLIISKDVISAFRGCKY